MARRGCFVVGKRSSFCESEATASVELLCRENPTCVRRLAGVSSIMSLSVYSVLNRIFMRYDRALVAA